MQGPHSDFRSFAEFWPFYLGEHSRPVTRALHFAGTTLALLLIVAGIVAGRPILFLAALVGAYGLAWIGHSSSSTTAPRRSSIRGGRSRATSGCTA